jgi:release factor glutamine methyltransferase
MASNGDAGAALGDPCPVPRLDRPAVEAALRAAGCVFAEEEAAILLQAAADDDELAVLVARRVSGEPLEHVVGWAEFDGLRVAVAPGVFVPRRRSEALVVVAAGFVGPGAGVLDLCCGSGALGLAVATRVPGVRVDACDIDPVAVRCARANLAPVGGSAYAGDLFGALPSALRGAFDLVVANVPYVPSGQIRLMPREARDFEPAAALDGGDDGLDLLRRMSAQVGGWLAPGGRVVTEVSTAQVPAAIVAFGRGGLAATTVHPQDDDNTVVLVGTRD